MSALSGFGTSRAHFEKMQKMYLDYVVLYKFFNRGHLSGVCNFADFYWMHHYHWKHKINNR